MKPEAMWETLAFLHCCPSVLVRIRWGKSCSSAPFVLVPVRPELGRDERRVRLHESRREYGVGKGCSVDDHCATQCKGS